MNDKTNELNKEVNVTMHTLSLSERDISYAKVKRNTAYIGNVIDTILEHNKVLDRETLLYAAGLFRNGFLELLKTGKAVDLLEMGILYIKPNGSIEAANPDIKDIPKMTLSFSPSELALEAVKGVSVAADVTESNVPQISELYDMHLRKSGNALSAGRSVRIKGKRLKVAGLESETGVFLASCDDAGKYSDDESSWIHVPPPELIDNSASALVFNIPEQASGSYRLLVRTAYGSGSRVNKTVRTGVFSDIVTVTTA